MDESLRIEALQAFFTEACSGRSPAIRRRYERVRAHLMRYLEVADVSRSLGTAPAALLEGERQFARDGAFLRLFGFEELICCIPDFLSESWMMPVRADARAQISLSERMLRWLSRNRLFDWQIASCVYWDAETALKQARARLRSGNVAHTAELTLPYESLDT